MKILVDCGSLNGEQEISEGFIEKDRMGRRYFTTTNVERYYECVFTTETGMPVYRWDPPTKYDAE